VYVLAGVLDDCVVAELDEERLHRVLAPKVDGAWHLHELTAGLDLRAFVSFSSVAGTAGSPGQAAYAAANTFLDALAAYRRHRGLAGTSLAWGFWEQGGVGMTAHLDPVALARLRREGAVPLSAAAGMRLLDAALARPEAYLVPVHLDRARLQRAAATEGVAPLLRELVRAGLGRAGGAGAVASGLRERLAALPEDERPGLLLDVVRGEVAAVLGLAGPEAVAPERPLKELGLDSLMAVELRNRLAAHAQTALPATLAFDHPTPRRLAAFVATRFDLPATAPVERASALADARLRELLERIPLADLEQSGLLDALERLSSGRAAAPAELTESQLDAMGDDELLRLAASMTGDADEH
jgi:type I polyketide synthase PikAII